MLKKVNSTLLDKHGRFHNYLRISLTEKCNLRCTYCMPEEGVQLSPQDKLLSSKEILELSKLFVENGVDKIRLTGGEPTVRRDLLEIVEGLNELKTIGLKTIGMTTNGLVLKRKLGSLLDAGMDQLNISLDTLDPLLFELITRRKGFNNVLDSIQTAAKMPFEAVKVNVVVTNVNENEILNFVELSKDLPLQIRFIEFILGNQWNRHKFIPYSTMLEKIKQKYKVEKSSDGPNDTTKHYQIPGFKGKFGFITSMSNHFCGTCNRIRLMADGNLKVCLFGNSEVNLRDLLRNNPDQLENVIGLAVKRKKKQHAGMSQLSKLPNRPMILIGGYHTMCGDSRKTGYKFLTRRFFSSSLSHVDDQGKVKMVNIGSKPETERCAVAQAKVLLGPVAFNLVKENKIKKGDVLTVAQIAGINGAKQTSTLIPLCHPLQLSNIQVWLALDEENHAVDVKSLVKCHGKTGVEMEAITAVSIASCTIYDMCKAVNKGIIITNISLQSKTGGKSDYLT